MAYIIPAHQDGDDVKDEQTVNEGKQVVEFSVRVGENTLYLEAVLEGGVLNQELQERLQGMVDTLLSESF